MCCNQRQLFNISMSPPEMSERAGRDGSGDGGGGGGGDWASGIFTGGPELAGYNG